jgi:MFS family permease
VSALFPADAVGGAYVVGAGMCGFSLVCAALACWLDRDHERRAEAAVKPAALEAFLASKRAEPKGGLRDALAFPSAYWLLAALCICCFASVTSFNNVSSAFLIDRWTREGEDSSEARVNGVMGILYSVAAGLASFAGALVDRSGHRAAFVSAAAAAVCMCHLLFALTDAPAEALLAVMGTAFALFASAFWPSIAFVVPKRAFGTAYGVMGAVQNTGLAVVPAVVGYLQPPSCAGGYACVEFLFAGLAGTGAALGVVAHVLERRVMAAAAAEGGKDAAGDGGSRRGGTWRWPCARDSRARDDASRVGQPLLRLQFSAYDESTSINAGPHDADLHI